MSHTLHLASEHNGWKSPQSQGETNTFALFSLAAGAGRWNWWLWSLTTWLQCHLLVTDTRAETTSAGRMKTNGRNSKKCSYLSWLGVIILSLMFNFIKRSFKHTKKPMYFILELCGPQVISLICWNGVCAIRGKKEGFVVEGKRTTIGSKLQLNC